MSENNGPMANGAYHKMRQPEVGGGDLMTSVPTASREATLGQLGVYGYGLLAETLRSPPWPHEHQLVSEMLNLLFYCIY